MTSVKGATWKRMRDDADRRRTLYWRLVDEEDRSLGSTRLQDDGTWRVLIYGPDRRRPSAGRYDLPREATRQAAMRAVEQEVRSR